MKILTLLLATTIALPVLADSRKGMTLQRTVVDTALANFGGVGHSETNDLEVVNIVMSDAAVGGNADVMEYFVHKSHGRVIAEELVESYRANEKRSERVPADEAYPIRVLRLDSFASSNGSWDWERLNVAYPEVKAIVMASSPAIDSQNSYAIVRFEVITRKGFAWGAFEEIEKQSDGTWLSTRGLVGDIRTLETPLARGASVDTQTD